MDLTKFRFICCIIVTLSLLRAGQCQQNPLFNQSPYQRQQLRQQFPQQYAQQQQRQQQLFPNVLNTLNPAPLAATLTPITPLTPIVPTNPYRQYSQLNQQNYVPITAYQNELNYDGSFSYGYSSADGTTAQAQGYVKNLGLGESVEAQVVQGSYSYTSPEGTPITVRYIADENGFRAEGAHIPTPPPIPDAIAKSLIYNANGQPYQQNPLNPNLNPYQTPYRQFPQQNYRQGQQLTPLQQQQQQRFLQQNSGQYQPDNQYGTPQLGAGLPGFGGAIGLPGQFPQSQFPQQQYPQGQFPQGQYAQGQSNVFGARINPQQNLTQQQGIAQQQQQQQQQNLQNLQNKQQQLAQNEQQQQQQVDQQQQQLAPQELRGRSNQLVNPFGFNPYRRFKKATTNK